MRTSSTLAPRAGRAGAFAVASFLCASLIQSFTAASLGAQTEVESFRDRCLLAGGSQAEVGVPCAGAALGLAMLQEGLSTAQSGGSVLPGSASTLGKRFATSPRWSLGVSARTTSFEMADVAGFQNGKGGGYGTSAMTLSGTLTIGLTEGFSPQPTVGGLFAVDILGSFGKTFLQADDGLAENPTHFGYGVRIGVLRESFTLPGVSVSAMRIHSAELPVVFGPASPDRIGQRSASAETGLTTTSVRATVGKEFMALGLLAGAGWDRSTSAGSLSASGFADPVNSFLPVSNLPYEGFTNSRLNFFGAISRTALIAQLSLEFGYTRGPELPTSIDPADFAPNTGAWWLTLGTRLTF